jgi:Zn-finger nucleic acid-binding protein
MSERSGIEIDYCPTCRGVWLDRGELDKIIERSFTHGPSDAPRQEPPRQALPYDAGYDSRGYHKPKRKESWLSELFD